MTEKLNVQKKSIINKTQATAQQQQQQKQMRTSLWSHLFFSVNKEHFVILNSTAGIQRF